MEENWYAVEQQVHDRITEARAAARIRALTQELAPPARRPNAIGITVIALANWAWARATQLPLALSHALANVRAATRLHRETEHPPCTKRSPAFPSGRGR